MFRPEADYPINLRAYVRYIIIKRGLFDAAESDSKDGGAFGQEDIQPKLTSFEAFGRPGSLAARPLR